MEAHREAFEECRGVEPADCEHRIEYQSMHEEYLSIFEKQITSFVRREDYTAVDFFDECRCALDGYGCSIFEEHGERWFVEALVAATDYVEWFRMMVKAAEEGGGGGRK